jgi:hypothetical protein
MESEIGNDISVLFNLGDGTFSPPTIYRVGAQPQKLAAIDVNGDGRPDLAVPNSNEATVSCRPGAN